MRKKIRRTLCMILATIMIITTAPVSTYAESKTDVFQTQKIDRRVGAVTPSRVNDAVKNFASALNFFTADTQKMIAVTSFLTRFGGVTSLTSGVIGILQMAGIIKDPSVELLKQILSDIREIKTELKEINKNIEEINDRLIEMQTDQKESERNATAHLMLTNWNSFNTNYNEPLDDKIEEYTGKINGGIKKWWNEDEHSGVRVIYTETEENKISLTYTDNVYEQGIPEVAGNGEEVLQDESFGIPSEYIPQTKTIASFNVNNYRDQFENAMAEKFIEAMDLHKVDANDAFYEAWNKLSENEKNEKAKNYATDILNTQIYHTSCEVMSDNDEWVIGVLNAFRHYCENATTKDSGIDAMINAIYLTHGFEGEAKDDLKAFCNGMIAKAGIYGQFAVTVACQDSMQSLTKREEIFDLSIDIINTLDEKKDLSITGYDNFCYITGTKVSFDQVKATSNISGQVVMMSPIISASYKADGWSVTVPNILDEVYSKVLYRQFSVNNTEKESFASYLNSSGTGVPANYNGIIMTKYEDIKDFKLDLGNEMIATQICNADNSFSIVEKEDLTGKKYKINKDNSVFKDDYFEVHDGITYEGMNISNGATMKNQWAGRAYYEKTGNAAKVFLFRSDNVNEVYTKHEGITVKFAGITSKLNGRVWEAKYTANIDVLKLEPCMDLNGDDESPNNPFFAYDAPVFTAGISDLIGLVVQNNKLKITDVKLNKDTFTYTGKEIKPSVTVKNGNSIVPDSNYDVTYENNKAIGLGTVKVKAKGSKYSGTITKLFEIVPKNTKIKSIRKGKKALIVKWKKVSKKMPKKRITGYQIRYATKSSMKKAKTVKIKGYKKTSKKIKGLKKNRKYYIQIRTYMIMNKTTVYSKWSNKKKTKTKK